MEVLDGCFVLSGHTEEKVRPVSSYLTELSILNQNPRTGDSYEARRGRVGIVIFNFKVHLQFLALINLFQCSSQQRPVTIQSYTDTYRKIQ